MDELELAAGIERELQRRYPASSTESGWVTRDGYWILEETAWMRPNALLEEIVLEASQAVGLEVDAFLKAHPRSPIVVKRAIAQVNHAWTRRRQLLDSGPPRPRVRPSRRTRKEKR